MKETVKQGQSLLERYHNAVPHETNPTHYPERNRLVGELENLLEAELCHEADMDSYYLPTFGEQEKKLLQEFRENFTWRQTSQVKVIWDVIADYVDYEDFDNKEKLVKFLGQDKYLMEEPDYDPYDLHIDIDGVRELSPSITVWELKPIKALKKSFEVVIKVETDTWDEEEIDRHFNSLFGEDTSGLQFALKEVNAIQDQCPSA